jgi:predicted nucleic acid-binding Zn ribbon protein
MSQFNDDEEREILQKRQRRQEDTTMRGSIDLKEQ